MPSPLPEATAIRIKFSQLFSDSFNLLWYCLLLCILKRSGRDKLVVILELDIPVISLPNHYIFTTPILLIFSNFTT
jgi:hypothetical protein